MQLCKKEDLGGCLGNIGLKRVRFAIIIMTRTKFCEFWSGDYAINRIIRQQKRTLAVVWAILDL